MEIGRGEFGPVRVAWADASASGLMSVEVLEVFGDQQMRRHASLSGAEAQRFLAGRWLLSGLIAEFTVERDVGLTTTCERCGGDHGRPRLERAPLAVSVSYAGSMVAVAAVAHADAAAVGVDLEPAPPGGPRRRLAELAPLFAPAPSPDTEGWTLLEAALKADGRGLAVDLSHVRVGEMGSGRLAGSFAVRVPGRIGSIDAGIVAGPAGFVLSAAVAPAAPRLRTG